jgi:hypothetical protein
MSVPGINIDPATGLSRIPPGTKLDFVVPTVPTGGTHRDIGSVVLSLVANWYISGETVLVDGGVCVLLCDQSELPSLVWVLIVALGTPNFILIGIGILHVQWLLPIIFMTISTRVELINSKYSISIRGADK